MIGETKQQQQQQVDSILASVISSTPISVLSGEYGNVVDIIGLPRARSRLELLSQTAAWRQESDNENNLINNSSESGNNEAGIVEDYDDDDDDSYERPTRMITPQLSSSNNASTSLVVEDRRIMISDDPHSQASGISDNRSPRGSFPVTNGATSNGRGSSSNIRHGPFVDQGDGNLIRSDRVVGYSRIPVGEGLCPQRHDISPLLLGGGDPSSTLAGSHHRETTETQTMITTTTTTTTRIVKAPDGSATNHAVTSTLATAGAPINASNSPPSSDDSNTPIAQSNVTNEANGSNYHSGDRASSPHSPPASAVASSAIGLAVQGTTPTDPWAPNLQLALSSSNSSVGSVLHRNQRPEAIQPDMMLYWHQQQQMQHNRVAGVPLPTDSNHASNGMHPLFATSVPNQHHQHAFISSEETHMAFPPNQSFGTTSFPSPMGADAGARYDMTATMATAAAAGRENFLLRQQLTECQNTIRELQDRIECLEYDNSQLRLLPTGKISQIPVEDMIEIMHVYGSEVSDTAMPPRKSHVQKASVVRQFRRWNPNFLEYFEHRNGHWVPKLGKEAELARRKQSRREAASTKTTHKKKQRGAPGKGGYRSESTFDDDNEECSHDNGKRQAV